MEAFTEELKLTGNYIISKRRFGGFNIKVEVLCAPICDTTHSRGPEYKYWRHATLEDLKELEII